MGTRTRPRAGVLIAAAITTTIGVLPAATAAGVPDPGWRASLLPLPDGYPDAKGYVTGTDGQGGYSGFLPLGETTQVVSWKDDKVTVHGLPDGTEFAAPNDQNRAGVIVGSALDYDTGESQGFILDGTGFHATPPPDGYASFEPVAINDRGDVVGTAYHPAHQAKDATVLWPVLGSGPIVIPNTDHYWQYPADLDEDGTILLNTDAGPYLWQNGVTRALEVPPDLTYPQANGLRNGLAVGTASSTQPGSSALLWDATGSVQRLPGGDIASGINASGLIVGRESSPEPYGPLTTWQGTNPAGRLPIPDGYQKGSARVVGDDGTIAGWVSNGPLDEGGHPAVWHYSQY
ncbi:hypothetical protein [Amycolatopsis nigrescens]|uniref:hypothetical protein n=1 Tax=Amycolatopsis nigrescens TaxID=381445 RepID=UPI0003619C40|nr:hypothetical protein [Amycolatopsis nigrescens]